MAVGGQSRSGLLVNRGDFGPLNDTDEPGGLACSRHLFETHGRAFLGKSGSPRRLFGRLRRRHIAERWHGRRGCHATTRSLFRAWNAGPEYNLARASSNSSASGSQLPRHPTSRFRPTLTKSTPGSIAAQSARRRLSTGSLRTSSGLPNPGLGRPQPPPPTYYYADLSYAVLFSASRASMSVSWSTPSRPRLAGRLGTSFGSSRHHRPGGATG